MTFPASLKTFTDRVNKRSAASPITGESHTIPAATPFTVNLTEVPEENRGVDVADVAATITFTERDYLPTASGDYYVDYTTGTITFYSADASVAITCAYDGTGSCCLAEDINETNAEIEVVQAALGVDLNSRWASTSDRFNKTSVGMCVAYASSTADKIIKFMPGTVFVSSTAWYEFDGYSANFGSGGNNQITIAGTSYQRIIFTYDPYAKRVRKYSGNVATTKAAAAWPKLWSYHEEVPLAGVTLQGDSTGAAGGVKEIEQSQIKDLRPALQAGSQNLSLWGYHSVMPKPGGGGRLLYNSYDGVFYQDQVSYWMGVAKIPKTRVQSGDAEFYTTDIVTVTFPSAFDKTPYIVPGLKGQPKYSADGGFVHPPPSLWIDKATLTKTGFKLYSTPIMYGTVTWIAHGDGGWIGNL